MHLGHHALQHDPAAQYLHVEMGLAQRLPRGFTHQREGARGAGRPDAVAAQVVGDRGGALANFRRRGLPEQHGLAMHPRHDAAAASRRLAPLALHRSQPCGAPGFQLVRVALALFFGIERIGLQGTGELHAYTCS
jgi:hypothetical protein